MSVMQIVVAVLIAGLAIGIKKAIEVTVDREYLGWASGLARACVRIAGFICRSHQAQWRSDLLFVQKEEGRSGLPEALSCVIAAPGLALQARVARKHHSLTAREYPAGQVIYESLKSLYVDLPALINTLRREKFTGYVRLVLADDNQAHVFFANGVDVEYGYRAGGRQRRGERARVALLHEVACGNGALDIIATG